MNTVFSCDNMLPYLDTIVNRIAPEMTQHTARWGGSYDDWQVNVERLRNFIIRRCDASASGMVSCYDLTGPYDITFGINPDSLGLASMQINSLTIDQFPYTGTYFGGVDLKLALLADTTLGYKFDRWLSDGQAFLPGDSLLSVSVDLAGVDTIIAHFVQQSTSAGEPAALTPALGVQPTAFKDATQVVFELPAAAPVSVRLFTLSGREAAVLADGSRTFEAGRYALRLDLARSGLPGGMYVLHFGAGAYQESVKIIYTP